MKKNNDIEYDAREMTESGSTLSTFKDGAVAKFGSHIKKIVYITSLAGIGFFVNSCVGGFVATEPVYVEVSRPPRPSTTYIWIDGDYYWNNQSHVYVQRTGYWHKPAQGQVYVAGYWQSGPKGKSWAPGHWAKENHKENKKGNNSRH